MRPLLLTIFSVYGCSQHKLPVEKATTESLTESETVDHSSKTEQDQAKRTKEQRCVEQCLHDSMAQARSHDAIEAECNTECEERFSVKEHENSASTPPSTTEVE